MDSIYQLLTPSLLLYKAPFYLLIQLLSSYRRLLLRGSPIFYSFCFFQDIRYMEQPSKKRDRPRIVIIEAVPEQLKKLKNRGRRRIVVTEIVLEQQRRLAKQHMPTQGT
ncbi:hypothetical protein POM88_031242 [Heracleum sosnowskyi]|uniref:Uncharacterized protein n=1 Tax=Heracleum sosnowskyi TaxID=360622 RepID=A0AAD8MJK8_9APIA|nr:hypothetical protein POM88_031242 [Heracleum sosnowskyi]